MSSFLLRLQKFSGIDNFKCLFKNSFVPTNIICSNCGFANSNGLISLLILIDLIVNCGVNGIEPESLVLLQSAPQRY